MAVRIFLTHAFSPKFLFITDTSICCALFGVADVVEQTVINKEIDWLRAARVATIGLVLGVAFLEGSSIRESLEEYRRKFFRVLALDFCVWPPTQTINFGLVPPKFRVAYVSVIQFFYNCFLTYIKHTEN